jgi:hypothetical protein
MSDGDPKSSVAFPVTVLQRSSVNAMGGEALLPVSLDDRGLLGDRWFADGHDEGHFASGKDTRRFRRRDAVFAYQASTSSQGVVVVGPSGSWAVGDPALDTELSEVMGVKRPGGARVRRPSSGRRGGLRWVGFAAVVLGAVGHRRVPPAASFESCVRVRRTVHRGDLDRSRTSRWLGRASGRGTGAEVPDDRHRAGRRQPCRPVAETTRGGTRHEFGRLRRRGPARRRDHRDAITLM